MTAALNITMSAQVAWIEIARPEVRNALTPGELHELAATLGRLDADPGIRAVVLTGQGHKAFSAGLNLRAEAEIATEMQCAGPTGLGAVLRRARAMRTPLVGRINGACVAGGVGLAAACDVVIAQEDAVFGLPELNVGLYPFVVLAALRDRVPAGVLAGLAATTRRIGAEEARSLGLVADVVPMDRLDDAVRRMTDRIRSLPSGQADALRFAFDPGVASDFHARMAEAEARTRAFRAQKIANS